MFLTAPELLAYALTTLAVMATPGVTVSALIGTVIAQGVGAGLATEAGAVVGRISMICLLALGLTTVLGLVEVLFPYIKIAGALYLIWLGVKTLRNPPRLDVALAGRERWFGFVRRGFLVLWGNPKALVFFGAFLPQFVHLSQPIGPQVAVLGAIWVATAIVTDCCYIVLAGGARRLFGGAFASWSGRVSGVILIGAGLWLASLQKA